MQGEDQKKLDVISNDIFCNTLRSTGRTGTIASEEEDLPVAVEETNSGNYVVVFDPLDGSSNIDAGISVGSIFGAPPATPPGPRTCTKPARFGFCVCRRLPPPGDLLTSVGTCVRPCHVGSGAGL